MLKKGDIVTVVDYPRYQGNDLRSSMCFNGNAYEVLSFTRDGDPYLWHRRKKVAVSRHFVKVLKKVGSDGKLPGSYKVQNGCENCGNCYIVEDYDSPDEFFCNHESKMPQYCDYCLKHSDKLFYGEKPRFYKKNCSCGFHDKYGELSAAFRKWAKGKETEARGICDKWVQKDQD